MQLETQIEAILFWRGEPVSKKELIKLLGTDDATFHQALKKLDGALVDRGVSLLIKDDEVGLGTNPAVSSLIEKLIREEVSRDLGKAGLETLSLVLYRGPIARSDIDYVRGVNSQFILRNLLIRGLIEKITDSKDQRRFLYKPTFSLMAHLGISKIEELPEWQEVQANLTQAEQKTETVATKEDQVEPDELPLD